MPRSRIIDLLKLAWRKWKAFAHVLGNFQARLLLTVFYVLIVGPVSSVFDFLTFAVLLTIFSAQEAQAYGLATRIADDPRQAAMEMARELAAALKIGDDTAEARIDTAIEVDYYKHGGILPYVLRDLLAA